MPLPKQRNWHLQRVLVVDMSVMKTLLELKLQVSSVRLNSVSGSVSRTSSMGCGDFGLSTI